LEKLNVGGAMNLTSGIFSAPVEGRYFFSFTALGQYPGSSVLQSCLIRLYKNGVYIGRTYSDEMSTVGQYEPLSLQSTLNLEKGDEIWVELLSETSGASLYGPYTIFNGFLLEEDISQSVKMLR
jgi:hypothetical protein